MSKKSVVKSIRSIMVMLLLSVYLTGIAPAASAAGLGVSQTETPRNNTITFSGGLSQTGSLNGAVGIAITNVVTLANGTVIKNDDNFPSTFVPINPAPPSPGQAWDPFTIVAVLDSDGKAVPHAVGAGSSKVEYQYFLPFQRPIPSHQLLYQIQVNVPAGLGPEYDDAKFELFVDFTVTQGDMPAASLDVLNVRYPGINYSGIAGASNYPLTGVPDDYTITYPGKEVIMPSPIAPAWFVVFGGVSGHFYIRNSGDNDLDPGTLTIAKQVAGSSAPDDTFSFTVMNNGVNLAGTYTVDGPDAPAGVQTIINGIINLKDGQTATIDDLEPGSGYKVVEVDPGANYTTAYEITGADTGSGNSRDTGTFQIGTNTTTEVTFTNTYTTHTNPVITKNVNGKLSELLRQRSDEQVWNITVDFGDADTSSWADTMILDQIDPLLDILDIVVKDGSNILAEGVDYGLTVIDNFVMITLLDQSGSYGYLSGKTYVVSITTKISDSVSDAELEPYTTSGIPNQAMLIYGLARTDILSEEPSIYPPRPVNIDDIPIKNVETGDTANTWLWITLLGVSVAGMAVSILYRRRLYAKK